MQDNGSWVDSAWTGRCQTMGDWLRLNYGNEPGYLDRYLREPKSFPCRQGNGAYYWLPMVCPKAERHLSPIAFAEWLLDLAARCQR